MAIPKGKWVPGITEASWANKYKEKINYQCDQCKHLVEEVTKFCPNCGADMRRDERRTRKDEVIRFKVSEEEKQQIVKLAEAYDMRISELIRYALKNEYDSYRWNDNG